MGTTHNQPDQPYREVDAAAARAATEDGAVLLDVREPQEWQAGHAPEAIHIPLGQLPTRVDEVPKGGEIMVICRSGNRSARAAAFLADRGDVANVAGGMKDWARCGYPVVAEGGGPGTVA
jgi:rhodanese-related sulfurtransferase